MDIIAQILIMEDVLVVAVQIITPNQRMNKSKNNVRFKLLLLHHNRGRQKPSLFACRKYSVKLTTVGCALKSINKFIVYFLANF